MCACGVCGVFNVRGVCGVCDVCGCVVCVVWGVVVCACRCVCMRVCVFSAHCEGEFTNETVMEAYGSSTVGVDCVVLVVCVVVDVGVGVINSA